MKPIFAVTISAIFTVMLLTGAQAAFADPGHSAFDKVPASAETCPGCQFQIKVGVAASQVNPVIATASVVVEDPDGDLALPTTTAGLTAQALTGYAGANKQYAMVDGADLPTMNLVCFNIPGSSPANSAGTFNIGPLGPAVSATQGVITAFQCNGGALTGPLAWIDISNPAGPTGVPNANIHGRYLVIVPGCDDIGTPGVCTDPNTTPDKDGLVFESYGVEVQVAGSVLPISSTALLLAGISTNALWILPTLGAIAGASFAVLRLQVHRKDI